MHISPQRVLAQYYGTPYLKTRNGYEVSLANFTIEYGENKLKRPVAGGFVESGALQNGGKPGLLSNVTVDTNSWEWFVHNFTEINLLSD